MGPDLRRGPGRRRPPRPSCSRASRPATTPAGRLGLRDRRWSRARTSARGRERPGARPRGHRVDARSRGGGARLSPARPERRRGQASATSGRDRRRSLLAARRARRAARAQACGCATGGGEYEAAGARVNGVAPDRVEAERKYAEQVRTRLDPACRRRSRSRRRSTASGSRSRCTARSTWASSEPTIHRRSQRQARESPPQGLAEEADDRRARGPGRAAQA